MSEQQIELAVSGLQTDPGPFSAAPGGALIEAENVSFRRPGVIEPRGPFAYTLDATDTTQSPISIFEWQGDVYSILDDNTIRKNASSTIGGGPASFTKGETWSSISNDRVIFTSDNGSYALVDGATDVRRTGSPRAMGFRTDVSHNGVLAGVDWLLNNYATAYRIVNLTFSGTVPMLGAPSEIRRVRNNSGSDGYVTITAYMDVIEPPKVGDIIQIYRALKVTPYNSDPADEMRLRTSVTLTSSDISAGQVTFVDLLDDGAWSGESLYTNESQDGLALSNYRPYQSSDVAFYNNMAFYAKAKTPERVSLTAAALGVPLGATAPSEWSQTFMSMDVTVTISVAGTLSTVAPAAFRTDGAKQGSIVVGQVITGSTGTPGTADGVFQANTKITSFNPTTGNMTWDKPTLSGPGAGFVVTCWDWIGMQVGVSPIKRIFASRGNTLSSGALYDELFYTQDIVSGFPGTGFVGGASDLERAWAATFKSSGIRLYANETGQGAYNSVIVTFERDAIDAIGAIGFTMYSTKPLAWNRYCDTVTGVASSVEGSDNTIVWSKYQEPEAVPLPYFKQLGPSDNVIQRLAVLKDTLFVFTTHGLYRFFGTDPESLIVDLFDPTIRLVDNRMLARSHNVLWAWTTRGVMQITAGGAERVDQPIAKTLDDSRVTPSTFATGNWWMTASDALDVMILGSDTPVLDADGNQVAAWNGYAFHTKTSCWAWWNGRRALTTATFSPDVSIVPYFGMTGGYAVNNGLLDIASAVGSSDHITDHFAVDSVVGTTVTLVSNTLWTVTVGDVIESTGPYYVTAVTSNTVFEVNRPGLATPNVHAGETCKHRVVWVGNAASDPMVDKAFIKATYPFAAFRNGTDITFVFSGYKNSAEYSTTSTYDLLLSPSGSFFYTIPQIHLVHVPHEVGRDWALRAGFEQSQAGVYWETAGLRLLTRYTGDKVARG